MGWMLVATNISGGWTTVACTSRKSRSPAYFSARGAGAHFLFILPTLDLVIVHRTDNEPPIKDAITIEEMANRGSIAEDRAQFGHLMKLILDAQTGH